MSTPTIRAVTRRRPRRSRVQILRIPAVTITITALK
jgi:hypothetical protein